MKRTDVELVLEKSRDFWRNHVNEPISLIDIHALAFDVWRKIDDERQGFREAKEYIFLKSVLDRLETDGDFIFTDEDGTEVYFRFLDDTSAAVILESGTLLICGSWDDAEEDDQSSSPGGRLI
jgi:hypothetical protein